MLVQVSAKMDILQIHNNLMQKEQVVRISIQGEISLQKTEIQPENSPHSFTIARTSIIDNIKSL